MMYDIDDIRKMLDELLINGAWCDADHADGLFDPPC